MNATTNSFSDFEHLDSKNTNSQGTDFLFRTIVDISPNIVGIVQEDKFVFINSKGLSILHCHSAQEVIGSSIFEFVDPIDHETIKEHFKNHVYISAIAPLQVKMLTTDRKSIFLEMSSIPFTYKNCPAVLFVGSDTTSEINQEEKLQEAITRYQEIFNYSHENLFLLEVFGKGRFKMLELNPQFEKQIGLPREQLIGKTFDDFAPAYVAATVNEKCQQCVDTQEVFNEEIVLELPLGIRFYRTRLVPIFNHEGQVCRINGIAWDVTDEMEKANLISRMASDSLYITQKNNVISKIKAELDAFVLQRCEDCKSDAAFKSIYRILETYSNTEADWGMFNKNFNNLHPKFVEKLKKICPSLTLNDVKHCACIRLRIDTKETARFFNVSPTSIQASRVRLKKKLKLPKEVDLRDFIERL